MGADIYLESVSEESCEDIFRKHEERMRQLARDGYDSAEDAITTINAVYEDMQATGGYFRNGYNVGDIMQAMGLSWWGTVGPMVGEDGYLPVAKAKELLAAVEARPLTKDSLRTYYVQLRAGMHREPVEPLMAQMDDEEGRPPAVFDMPLDEYVEFVSTRRNRLIAILRKSIELNEPLRCSL